MSKAIYAGTFDPPTVGHEWMIRHGRQMFDSFVVAIGQNPDKKYLFDLDTRLKMLKNSSVWAPDMQLQSFEGFLICFAQENNAQALLRGIRNASDYEYERTMRQVNADIAPEITTVFLMPPRDIAEVSSSLVKGLVGPKGWEDLVKRYVNPFVLQCFKERT